MTIDVDFCDYFWGEGQKTTGIEVLFQNAKLGVTVAKEVADYLKERSSLEETHSKNLSKLSKVASNGCATSSFSPMWQVLKNLSDKLASAHTQMVGRIEELVKELLKYADELQKQYKSVKENEAGTVEGVQAYQNSKNMVAKTKTVYMQRYLELEKLQKDGAPQKDVEKLEVRMKKAQEEYKVWVEKYQMATEEYVAKMTESCKKFQEVETVYLDRMKVFMDEYAAVMDNNHDIIGQVHTEFRSECAALTVEDLLQQMLRQKATGNTRPSAQVDVEDTLINLEGSGGSSEDKSSLGERESKNSASSITINVPGPAGGGNSNVNNTTTTNANPNNSGTATEKIFEGNNMMTVSTSSRSVSLLEERPPSKGSRRTTSLLNLFIPQSQQQGSKNSTAKGIDSPNSLAGTEVDNRSLSRSGNSRGSKWFLRSRRGKKKDKKNKDKDSKDGEEGGNKDLTAKGQDGHGDLSLIDASPFNQYSAELTNSPKVDAEGYTIRPNNVWEDDNGKFYSDSDTDSEEEPERRLHVEIKPLPNGTTTFSASVDELRTTVENMTLSSSSVLMSRKTTIVDPESQMKRSHSVSQQIGNTSPPSKHPYAPLSPPLLPHNKTSPANTNANDANSRYAELGDLFAEVGEMQPSLPPKMSMSRTTPTGNSISVPRPPSRPRPEIPLMPQRNANSPSPVVSRTDSVASLETRSIASHLSGSRGPSPLTLGMSDSIPIAVAFHEIVHAYFKGNDENKCKVKMTGDMMLSFPAGIIQVFANNPSPSPLSFYVRSKQKLESLSSNKNLVKVDNVGEMLHFEFDMSALTALLRSHAEQNPNASYFNVDILKYQIQPKPGATSCPLHLVAFWKCEISQTDLRIDYKYNKSAMECLQSEVAKSPGGGNDAPAPLSQVCIAAPVDGGVTSMQSKPVGQWFSSTNRACWKLPSLSIKSDNLGVGSLRARFEITSGPSSNGTVAAQFSCENSTLSGCEFELLGSGYRVSLVKKRFVSGKYICDAEENSNRYAVPPSCSKPVQL